MRQLVRLLVALFFVGLAAPAVAQWQVPNHYVPVGKGAGSGFSSASVGTAGRVFLDKGASADPGFAAMSGDATINSSGVVVVGKLNGVSGPSSGTSGGVPYYSSTSALSASAALAANQIVLGGGAGIAPATLGSLGTTTTILHGNASGAPTFGAAVSADLNITTTSCTNQFVTAISSGGVGTCTTDALAGAQHANQGTTTTVLHGNASGNPSWGSLNFATDGTGIVPAANGGAGTISGALKANGSGTVSQAAASDLSNGTTGSGSVVLAANPTITGTETVSQAVAWSGDISPAQITSNTNDYAPTGFSTATTLRLNSDASRNVTGLAGGAGGRIIVIHNVGSFNIVLTNQDSGSTAANRFLFGGDVTLGADTSITIKYDTTSSRWRAMTSPGAGGVGGGVTGVGVAAGVGVSTSGTCTITTSGTCTVSMADQYRQNDLLMCANQAKALAAYQRILATFCDGYKASDGVNSGSSSNYAVNTTSGYVGPTFSWNGSTFLMHADGANNSTTFSDAIGSVVLTPAGNAKVDTGQSKFGGASLALDGSGDWVSADSSSGFTFGTGDFTIDFWLRLTSTAGTPTIFDFRNTATQAASVLYLGSGKLFYFVNAGNAISGSTTLSTSTWYHVALVRSSGTTKLFLNGVQEGSSYTDSNNYVGFGPRIGAQYDGSNGTNGWIDEFRVSKGTAQWSTTFTPPSSAYAAVYANATVVTTSQTADATISWVRLLEEIDPIDSITLNTDLTGEVTCNGGSNWASATFSSVGKGQSGRTVIESADTSCGANTGTSFAARLKTLNSKNVNFYKTTVTVH